MKRGFTLVELLLVIGIFAILATIFSLTFFSTVNRSYRTAAEEVLIADLKSVQASAMSGEGQSGVSVDGWGLIVNNQNTYTLFPGLVYDQNNPLNYTTTLRPGITISSNFPSSSVIFNHASGEVKDFVDGSNTFTLSDQNGSSIIRLNRYGAVIGD